jgi:hypothetical protein
MSRDANTEAPSGRTKAQTLADLHFHLRMIPNRKIIQSIKNCIIIFCHIFAFKCLICSDSLEVFLPRCSKEYRVGKVSLLIPPYYLR